MLHKSKLFEYIHTVEWNSFLLLFLKESILEIFPFLKRHLLKENDKILVKIFLLYVDKVHLICNAFTSFFIIYSQ